MVGRSKRGNEHEQFRKSRKFSDELSDYQLLKDDPAPLN
jgi:hypothetical protein